MAASAFAMGPAFAAVAAAAPQDELLAIRVTNLSSGTTAEIRRVELEAGALSDEVSLDLASITPGGLLGATSAAVVAGQLWLGTADGVVRYDETPASASAAYSFADQILQGRVVRAIRPTASGAVLLLPDQIAEVDATGAILQLVDVAASYIDILPHQGGYLASTNAPNARVRLLDASFQFVSLFAEDARNLALSQGLSWFPEELTQLASGRIAICAQTTVGVVESDGSVVSLGNPCLFEQRIYETNSGLLAVGCANGTHLVDPDTMESFTPAITIFDSVNVADVYSIPFDSARSTQTSRFCTSSPNSTGKAARVSLLGSTEPAVAALSLVGSSMPRGSFALPIFGAAPYDVPYGNGRLCISPFQPGISRGPVLPVSDLGGTDVRLQDAGGAASAIFIPGSTWYFQYVFRDGGAFDTTDGVSITFRQ